MSLVTFDPSNVEHVKAFKMLCYGVVTDKGLVYQQHKTLRFKLEHPFVDIRTMMFHKIGQQFISNFNIADEVI